MTDIRLSLLVALGLLTGCAATIPTELADARRAYADVSAGPAATLVPAEVHKAQEALNEAEAAFKQDPRGYHTKDLAYVAQRKAQLAGALADTSAHESQRSAANSVYQSTQDAIMRNTKAELGATQSNLAATQSAAARTSAELATSESARAQTSAQLATSEAARLAAEKRTADAMAALARLAAVKEETRGLVITLSGSVLFRSDEATLLPDAQSRLGGVADALLETKERRLLIEGHTDSQGSDAYNLDLSQRRAEAVGAFLVARGYPADHIRSVGIGEARAVADNATAEGRANNRRVEIVIEPAATAAK